MVNLLKKCWISDAAWRKSICFGLVFVVTLAVLGHDLQGEMTFSQSRLLCTLLFYVQMITSLKLGLLHKIGQNMTNPSENSSSSTYFPLDKYLLFRFGCHAGEGGRAGGKVPPAPSHVLGWLGRWLHHPLTSHSTAGPGPKSPGRYLWHQSIGENSPCEAPGGNTALSACNSPGSLTCSFLS